MENPEENNEPKPGDLVRITAAIETDTPRNTNPAYPAYLKSYYHIPRGSIVMFLGYIVDPLHQPGSVKPDFRYSFLHGEKVCRTKWWHIKPKHFFKRYCKKL